MRPIDVTDFQDIGQTAWEGMAIAEVRHFARGLSGSGVAADARAIGSAGNAHADSLAELQRDTVILSTRWSGEAKDQSYVELGDFVRRAYTNAVALRRLVQNVDALSETASTTNELFSDLPDPPSGTGPWADSGYRNTVAEAMRSTYSAPVQTSASTLPLGTSRGSVGFDHIGPGNTKRDYTGSAAPEEAPSVEPAGTGAGSGTGTTGAGTGAGTTDTGTGTGGSATTTDGTARGTTDPQTGAAASGTGAGSGAGTTGGGSGTGAATGTDTGPGTDTGTDPLQDDAAYDPVASADDPSSSLLSPSAAVPVTSAARTGAGISGLGGGRAEVGRTASPLGLRQDAAVARSAAPQVGAGTSTGARPSSGPFGMPAAGAGGQRGQGDGRHRVPAYLIDRRNGEELVGGMPLVGPGVIGQWKSDGPPDAPRPPATSEPRPR